MYIRCSYGWTLLAFKRVIARRLIDFDTDREIKTSKTKVLQLPAAGVWHGSVKTAKFWQQYEYQTQPKYANWPVARKHLVLQDMVFKDQNAQSLKFSEIKICSSMM